VLGLLLAGSLGASDDYPEFRRAEATRAEVAPAVDGEVLGDPSWDAAPVLSDFVQTTPIAGQPASERTEVRVLYDDETLYFGVVCYDREARGIVVADSRRDSPLEEINGNQSALVLRWLSVGA
jgi:hypothetical protein